MPLVTEAPTLQTSFELIVPLPRMLTSQEELALFRSACERDGAGSSTLRYALAAALHKANHFEELLGLLRAWNLDDYRFVSLETDTLLSTETPETDREAEAAAHRALAVAANGFQRADALTTLAKLCIRLGKLDEARRLTDESLALDARGKDAYKRAVALDLRAEAPEQVLTRAQAMLEAGIAHSRVLCSRSLALAQMGRIEDAHEAQGLDRFLARFEPAPPEGWETLEDFNRELAAEITHHPDIRYNRYGTASAHTWRIDEPSLRRSRVFPALQSMIAREIQAYVDRLPPDGHPFVEGRPAAAFLRNWVVITEGDGHETWHVHQNGWLSGVYYIQVQDHIAHGTGREGCIAFGLPEDIIGQENHDAFGEQIVRPRTGLMMIFPSHAYHRTYPHHGDGQRICYAFDTIPTQPRAPGAEVR